MEVTELTRVFEHLPADWAVIRAQIAEMEDIGEIVAAEQRAKALAKIVADEDKTNRNAFGLGMCALDLMARAGKVIEEMQARGELATQASGRPKNKCTTLGHLLGDGARNKSSRYKTAAKADRDAYYESLDPERDKPSFSGFCEFHGIGRNLKATQGRKQNEWYTPKEYVEAAREVMGSIDLDPASSKKANKVVQATTFYTKEDSGLDYDWLGTVYMNPPFEAKLALAFIGKLCHHHEAGNVPQAVLLTNNNTDTSWWHQATALGKLVCFTVGRVAFYDPSNNAAQPTNGHTFTYFGKRQKKFTDVFSHFGTIMRLEREPQE